MKPSESFPTGILSAYDRLAAEKQQGTRHEGLWLKCITEAAGDPAQAEIAYNTTRVSMFEQEAEDTRRADLAQRAQALVEWRTRIMDHLDRIKPWFDPTERCFDGLEVMSRLQEGLESAFADLRQALPDLRNAIDPAEWQEDRLNAELATIAEQITQERAFSENDKRPPLPWSDCFSLATGRAKWQELEAKVAGSLADIENIRNTRQQHVDLLQEASEALALKDVNLARDRLDRLTKRRFADVDYASVQKIYRDAEDRSHDNAVLIMVGVICVVVALGIIIWISSSPG